MILFLKDLFRMLFLQTDYGCVPLRIIYTISFILYKLTIIKFNLLKQISSILFIPLIIAVLGGYLTCFYYELFSVGCISVKNLSKNKEKQSEDKLRNKLLDNIRYGFKLAILYLVTKYIKPEFNVQNIVIPFILTLAFFYFSPLEKSHFGKTLQNNFGQLSLYIFLLICATLIFYIITKFYKKINIYFFLIWFLIYIIISCF